MIDDIPLEIRAQLNNDVFIYGNAYAEKRDGTWRRLDPTSIMVMKTLPPKEVLGPDGKAVERQPFKMYKEGELTRKTLDWHQEGHISDTTLLKETMMSKKRINVSINLAEDVSPIVSRLNDLKHQLCDQSRVTPKQNHKIKTAVMGLRQLQSKLYQPERLIEHFMNVDITEDCHLYEMFERIGDYVCTDDVLEYLAQGDIDVLMKAARGVVRALEGESAGKEAKQFESEERERKEKTAMGDVMNPTGPVYDDGMSSEEIEEEVDRLRKVNSELVKTNREMRLRLDNALEAGKVHHTEASHHLRLNTKLRQEVFELMAANTKLKAATGVAKKTGEDVDMERVCPERKDDCDPTCSVWSTGDYTCREKNSEGSAHIRDGWQINVERVLIRFMSYLDFSGNDYIRESEQWRALLSEMTVLMPDFDIKDV